MRKLVLSTLLSASLLATAGCEGIGTKQGVGTLGGAAAGGRSRATRSGTSRVDGPAALNGVLGGGVPSWRK